MSLTLQQPSNGRIGPYSLVIVSSDTAFPGGVSIIVQVADHVSGVTVAYTEFTFHFAVLAGQTFVLPAGGGVNLNSVPGSISTFDWPEVIIPDGNSVDIFIDFSGPPGSGLTDQHTFTGNVWDRVGNPLGIAVTLLQTLGTLITQGGSAAILAAVQTTYQNQP